MPTQRRAAQVTLACLIALVAPGAACSANTSEPPLVVSDAIDSLIGEVHLHAYADGSHPAALFVAAPLPVSGSNGDDLVDLDPPIVAREGPCALHTQPTCAPACGGASLCLRTNTCVPIAPLSSVDDGPVVVSGSRTLPSLGLRFSRPDARYVSDPAPGPPLFAGGETLRIDGGVGDYTFTATLLAPDAVVVTRPDLTRDLHFPVDGPFVVEWMRAQSLPMTITLTASTVGGGGAGFIVCVVADTGSLEVPASLLRGLPSPPRDLFFNIERRDLQLAHTRRRGLGVIVHAGSATSKNGRDSG